mgnify:CR=1 FL=1
MVDGHFKNYIIGYRTPETIFYNFWIKRGDIFFPNDEIARAMGVDGADGEARLGDALRDGEAGGATADDKVGRATNAEASETARRVCLCSALGNNREKSA